MLMPKNILKGVIFVFLLFGAAFLLLAILGALHYLFVKNVSPSYRTRTQSRVFIFLIIGLLFEGAFVFSLRYVEEKTTYSDPEKFDTLTLAIRHGDNYFNMLDSNEGHIATVQTARCHLVIDYMNQDGKCTMQTYRVTKSMNSPHPEIWGMVTGIDIFYLIPNINVNYVVLVPEEYPVVVTQ